MTKGNSNFARKIEASGRKTNRHASLLVAALKKKVSKYFPLPNIRPGSLIFFRTKSPWGRPYFNQVSNFSGGIFPMGSLIMTGSLICFSDVEAACFEKEAFKRGYLWIWIKKGVAN